MTELEPTSPVESVTDDDDDLDLDLGAEYAAEVKERERFWHIGYDATKGDAKEKTIAPETLLEYVRLANLTPAEAIRVLGNKRFPVPSKVCETDIESRQTRIDANAESIDKIYEKLLGSRSAEEDAADPIRKIRLAEREADRGLDAVRTTLDHFLVVRNSDEFTCGNQIESVLLEYLAEGTIELPPIMVRTFQAISATERRQAALVDGLFDELRDAIWSFSDSYYEIFLAIRAFNESNAPEPPAPAEPDPPTP
jgi:hypothetical protein